MTCQTQVPAAVPANMNTNLPSAWEFGLPHSPPCGSGGGSVVGGVVGKRISVPVIKRKLAV